MENYLIPRICIAENASFFVFSMHCFFFTFKLCRVDKRLWEFSVLKPALNHKSWMPSMSDSLKFYIYFKEKYTFWNMEWKGFCKFNMIRFIPANDISHSCQWKVKYHHSVLSVYILESWNRSVINEVMMLLLNNNCWNKVWFSLYINFW